MESLEALAEIIIGTLKEFSTSQVALTPSSLGRALSERKDLPGFLPQGVPTATSGENAPQPLSTPGTSTTESLERDASDTTQVSQPSLPQVRDTYIKILAALGPIVRAEYVERSSDLQRRLEVCQSIEALTELGADMVSVVRLLVDSALEDMDHASDILAELDKDLSGVEERLFSYRDHNRETYQSNDRFTSHLLLDTEEMSQAFTLGHILEDVRGVIVSKLASIRSAVGIKRQEDETRLRDADRKIDELRVSLQGYKEEAIRIKERAEALEKEVLLDALTEIHNRRAYELRIREEMRRYRRDGQVFSLILIDVDCFKQINDLYGHSTGDKCLRGIAGKIKGAVRATDFLARYGGEEFALILAGSSAENAQKIAEKIRTLIEKTRFSYRDEDVPVTISLGVTEVKSVDVDPEALFVRVDDAMYRAKKEGRNRVCLL